MPGTTDDLPPRDLSEFPIVDEEPTGFTWTPGRVLLGIIVLASFGVWVYAYSGQAARDAPDLLSTDGFGVEGEQICQVAMADFEALPDALDASGPEDRSRQVTTANDRLRLMVSDLRVAVSGNDRDRQLSDEWLDDWDAYIEDRQDFADRMLTEDEPVLYVRAVDGERLERRITRFADTNQMYTCATPQDIG